MGRIVFTYDADDTLQQQRFRHDLRRYLGVGNRAGQGLLQVKIICSGRVKASLHLDTSAQCCQDIIGAVEATADLMRIATNRNR